MPKPFGELKRVDIRDIWANEAADFSPWLSSNIQALGNALGLELEFIEGEASVGEFAVDILARDLGTGHEVIIENQFGATDHDHLGKLMTYAAGFDVSTVIWIAESIREEHRQALDWLNQRTGTKTQFFGIVAEVIQIDESRPAYTFRPVVFPNEWQKTRRARALRPTSSRAEAYRQYFQELIDELREKYQFTGARVGQPQNWYSFTSGLTGITLGASFAHGGRVRVDLYIDQGDAEANKALFDELVANKDEIEHAFGSDLEWERLDDKRASRVAIYRPGAIEDKSESLAEYRQWTIEQLLKLKEVFVPRLDEMRPT